MSVPQISIDDLESLLASGARLFDVRELHEYVAGHVAGAIHIALGEVPAHVERFAGDGPAHIICQAGGRSQRAAEFLVEHGVEAINVAGGTGAWAASGRPLVVGDLPS